MTPGRNDPCPCGSGKKFKHCCGGAAAAQAAGADPENLAALVMLVNHGHLEEAERRVSARLRSQPQSGLLWKILSVALMRQRKDALPALQRAAQLLPQDAEAYTNLGAELNARGQWEPALGALRQALQLAPQNPDALLQAGNAQRYLGRPAEAVKLYAWALQADPQRIEAHHNLGNALLDLGQSADAVRCYRQALQLAPENAQILASLGNALRQDGHLEEALACSRRAVELEPQLALAHNNAGVILAARGAPEQAIAHYRAALASQPRYAAALGNLGAALWQRGERREAVEAYERATELAPARPELQCALGYALLELGRVPEAAERFRATLALQPGSARAQLGFAAALRVLGQHAEAESCVSAVLASEPASAPALALLGELKADRGHFEEAQALFGRALSADPKCATAYAGIASHRRMTSADQQWLSGAQALLAAGAPVAEEIPVRYAVGKYFDDVGEYEQAFASYRAANELARAHYVRYEPTGLTALVERTMARCDTGFLRRSHAGSSDSSRPVFIIGMPRSGTSLAEQILASHPQVHGAGEIRFWDRAAGALQQAMEAEDGAAQMAQVARDYLERSAAGAGGATRITDKMPGNFLYVGWIHAVLPQARIIHMQRHPLDTCLSIYFQNFFNATPFAHDFADLAHYYGQYQRLMAHWRQALPSGTLLDVSYEELVQNGETWTRRLLEFVELPWDERCLRFHATERVVITASKWQVRQPLYGGSAGRWRNYERHLGVLRPLLQDSSI